MTPKEKQILLMRMLDNTASPENWQDLGILVFARHFFPDIFDSEFSKMHYDVLKCLLQLYDPLRKRRTNRQMYINIHREAAKTTISSFLFPLYQIFLKGFTTYVRREKEDGTFDIFEFVIGERFIMLCSETATAAESLVTDIKTVIEQRTDICEFLGDGYDKHPKAIIIDDEPAEVKRNGDKLWRKNAFITADNTVVWGVGSGQQVRGKKILGSRPTLILVDDMYGDNKVLTEQSRKKLDKWFYASLANSADSVRGKLGWLGTLVHIDTVITKMKKSDMWFGLVIPIISMEELSDALGHCKITSDEVIIPSDAECDRLQEGYTTLSWGSRHTLAYILSLYKQCYEDKNLKYFYQEYLNTTQPPEEEVFPDRKFLKVPLHIRAIPGKDTIDFEFSFEHLGITWAGRPAFSVGIDWASGESDKSDDVAMCAMALCLWQAKLPGTNQILEKTLPLFYHMEGGRYGIYNERNPATGITKQGICESIEMLNRKVPLDSLTMEVNGQQGTVAREVRRFINEKNIKQLGKERKLRYVEQFSQGNKEQRIRAVMEPLVEKHEFVIINSDCPMLNKMILQLQTLGSTDHDDYADAAAIATAEVKTTKKVTHKAAPSPEKQRENYRKKKLQAPGQKRYDSWVYR